MQAAAGHRPAGTGTQIQTATCCSIAVYFVLLQVRELLEQRQSHPSAPLGSTADYEAVEVFGLQQLFQLSRLRSAPFMQCMCHSRHLTVPYTSGHSLIGDQQQEQGVNITGVIRLGSMHEQQRPRCECTAGASVGCTCMVA